RSCPVIQHVCLDKVDGKAPAILIHRAEIVFRLAVTSVSEMLKNCKSARVVAVLQRLHGRLKFATARAERSGEQECRNKASSDESFSGRSNERALHHLYRAIQF